ncbi:MAG: replicative DNA helicase [Bryobacteraceae bacterium]|nr:replicative DNA helicase [Bryobacteraceae bacterium]
MPAVLDRDSVSLAAGAMRTLPANLDAERLVLGSILLDPDAYITVAGLLAETDFSLEAHRRIYVRMGEIYERGARIDRVTVAEELSRQGQLESVGGLSYLLALDENLPQIYDLESYIGIVREKAMLRKIILTSQQTIDRCFLAQEDALKILGEAEQSLIEISGDSNRDSLLTPHQIIDAYEGGMDSLLDPSTRVSGISTGFIELDRMTGGFRGGELIILAARPAMGKTALALNIGQHIATNRKNPKTVALFSLEMSKESLLTRMICATARVDQSQFRAGKLEADERYRLAKAATGLMEAPLFIDDSSNANLMDMHSKLRRLKAEHGLGLVIVDYLQLMTARGRHENRVQEVSALSRGLKLLSKELNVPVLVLSQLSRAPESRPGDHRPQLSDLRESGSIEQDADLVAFVFREEYYKPDRADLKGEAEIILAKQRNGPVGKIKLVFLHQFTKFENRADDFRALDKED